MAEKHVFGVLEYRLWLLLVVLVSGVWGIHTSGPFELQSSVDRAIVRPIVQSGAALASLLHLSTPDAHPAK